jgi:hypothetical protein
MIAVALLFAGICSFCFMFMSPHWVPTWLLYICSGAFIGAGVAIPLKQSPIAGAVGGALAMLLIALLVFIAVVVVVRHYFPGPIQ